MSTTQELKTKEYETIYILRSDVDTDGAEKVQSRVAEVVAREQGKLVKVESWGRRRLAYNLSKHRKGVYVYVKYVGRGGLVAEIERNLKLSDHVLKFQTVMLTANVDVGALQIDPEEVKLGKLELAPEVEEAESREKQLGLVDLPDAPRERRDMGEEDYAEDDDAGEGQAAAAPEKKDEEETP